ncbi:MAG TPA: hypothetical protein VLL27_10955 [Solirubrobacterales bacterium]|nr:hypothetical protein [Solirubrobacterales bacterium]
MSRTKTTTDDLIRERAIAWGQSDEFADRYPNRSFFLAADSPYLDEHTRRAFSEGHPVVLVFPNGDEVVIEPGENGMLPRVEVRDSDGQPLAA